MRDPERIPIVLGALEREWRKYPDQRLGQLVVNLLRINTNVPPQDEGRFLFNIEDGELLRLLGPQGEAEETYIREERREAREARHAWDRSSKKRALAEKLIRAGLRARSKAWSSRAGESDI